MTLDRLETTATTAAAQLGKPPPGVVAGALICDLAHSELAELHLELQAGRISASGYPD